MSDNKFHPSTAILAFVGGAAVSFAVRAIAEKAAALFVSKTKNKSRPTSKKRERRVNKGLAGAAAVITTAMAGIGVHDVVKAQVSGDVYSGAFMLGFATEFGATEASEYHKYNKLIDESNLPDE